MLWGSGRVAASLTCMACTCMNQVYLSLLRMYLSPPSVHCLGPIKLELLEPQANLQAALQVLELHHSKLDTTKVSTCQGNGGHLQGSSNEKWGWRRGLRASSSVASAISSVTSVPPHPVPISVCRPSTFCQQTLRLMTYAFFWKKSWKKMRKRNGSIKCSRTSSTQSSCGYEPCTPYGGLVLYSVRQLPHVPFRQRQNSVFLEHNFNQLDSCNCFN